MDPSALSACVPGSHEFKQVGPDTYDVVLQMKVGVISGTYSATIVISEKDEPASYRMGVEGKGARTTLAGSGTVTLMETAHGTDLRFEGESRVTGMLARVGQRLMGTVARAQIDQFFECIGSRAAAGPRA